MAVAVWFFLTSNGTQCREQRQITLATLATPWPLPFSSLAGLTLLSFFLSDDLPVGR
jgi:hypothetical protein